MIGFVAAERRTSDGLMALLVRFAINAVALFLASEWVTGIDIEGWESLLAGAAIFGVVNALIKPIVFVLSCPFLVLTLGLFTLVINAAMLGLAAWVSDRLGLDFTVDGVLAAFLGALLISFVSLVLSATVGNRVKRVVR